MAFKQAVGFDGLIYDSQAEAKASFLLAEHDILKAGGYLPLIFHDRNGVAFKAKSDFSHAPTGVQFEFKTRLNAVQNKASSDSQLATSLSRCDDYKALQFGWNHSPQKLDIVQREMARAGHALVAIFPTDPDEATKGRLARLGTFWLVLGSQGWTTFISFLKFARYGIAASMTCANDKGQPMHVFTSGAWQD